MNENIVIDELKKKNKDALDYVLDTYGKQIYTVAFMELKSRVLSEECLNDVILKIWVNIDSYKYEKSQFKNWVLTIAKYTAIDILRKEKRHFTPKGEVALGEEKDSASLEEDVLSREELSKVLDVINTFSDVDKIIFVDRFFAGKGVKEIAKELGMTQNSISLRINKGRKRLKEIIKREG